MFRREMTMFRLMFRRPGQCSDGGWDNVQTGVWTMFRRGGNNVQMWVGWDISVDFCPFRGFPSLLVDGDAEGMPANAKR